MAKTSNSVRLEKLRKARSLNDVLAVLKDIAKEVTSGKVAVSQLQTSLSADGEIVIDHTGGTKAPPRKVKVGGTAPNAGSFGLKLDKFVAPPIALVQKHYSVINKLHDNANELEAAEALIKQTFANAKNQKQTLVAIKALRAEVDGSLQKAFTALDSIAQKHLPTEMEQLGDTLVSYMIDHLNPRSYENMEKEVYVAIDEDKNIVFSLYVALHGLKNGAGFVFDEYYVILTGVINAQSKINYYLNAVPEFKVPGKYPMGKLIATNSDLLLRISVLFAHNEIISELERVPMSLDTDRARTGGFVNITNVDDAYVLEDALYLVVSKGKENPTVINSIVVKVIPLLNQLIGNAKRTKASIKHRLVKRDGHTVLQFILTPPTRVKGEDSEYTLNLGRLSEIQEMLGLSDKEVQAIKAVLKQKA